jgi:hypothetical protein
VHTTESAVLEMMCVIVRALALACRGHQELVLENLALREQLSAFKRRSARPPVRRLDRLFWIVSVANCQSLRKDA